MLETKSIFFMKTLLYLIDMDLNIVLWIVSLQLVKLICGIKLFDLKYELYLNMNKVDKG